MIAKQLNTPSLIALATSDWGGALINQEAVNLPDFNTLSDEDRYEISRATIPDVEDLRGAVDVLWNFSDGLLGSKAWLIKKMNSAKAVTGSAVVSQFAPGNLTFASISIANSFYLAEFDDLLQQLRTYSKTAYPESYVKVLSSLQKSLDERERALLFYRTLPQMSRVLLELVVVKFVLDRSPDLHSSPSNAGQKRSNHKSGSHKSSDKLVTTWADGVETIVTAFNKKMTQELPRSFWSKIRED